MCGIAGFTIAPGDLGHVDTEVMTAVLGYEMMSRGKDATGILTVDKKGRWKLRKKPYPANVFLAGRAGIGVSASSLLLHTRAATQGKPHISGNNHPIQYGDVIGIHNGIIWNDDKLFEHYKWDRIAEVDSEAIFAALHHLPQNDALTNIDGGWAISWVNTNDDPRKLWLARGSSSPLFYATTQAGSVVFASTYVAVKEAFKHSGITGDPVIHNAPEGFLAHTNPDDGGISILPEFDHSGDTAIGARKKWANTGGGWQTTHGTYVSYGSQQNDAGDWERKPALEPADFTRVQITGVKSNPKVGDRRKYRKRGEWIYEACTSVSPACWAELHESKLGFAHPGESTTGYLAVPPPAGEAVVLPFDHRNKRSDTPADDDFWAANDRYGCAAVGDLICIPKKHFSHDDSYGGIIGIVKEIDDDTKDMLVDWRPGHLSMWAEYEVLIKAQTVNELSEETKEGEVTV